MKRELPLTGLKVLDLSWIIAGPLAASYLAIHGANVIRVESETRVDITRSIPPWADGIPGRNRAGLYNSFNVNKLGIQLNLKTDGGREILSRLIAWSDIVLESFAPGVTEKLGLTYAELKKVKPDLIMVSFSMQGQDGPKAAAKGFGTELQALVGFSNFIGYPGESPLMTTIPYTDFVIPWFALIAILAALQHRRRTGEGQYIDISHLETGATFLGVKLMDYLTNGNLEPQTGNRSPRAAPHGAYRLRGQDRWCVIAIFNERQWGSLRRVMGNPHWARHPKFHTFANRKKNEDELDRLILLRETSCCLTNCEIIAQACCKPICSKITARMACRWKAKRKCGVSPPG
jgi:crotonobetainyl-CoA:carnitine CoA-transferase CaiB-like acyl-CoA transferase